MQARSGRIVSHRYLRYEHLRSLCDRELLAVQIKSFYRNDVAARLAGWFQNSEARKNYAVYKQGSGLSPSTTDKIGSTMNETYDLKEGAIKSFEMQARSDFQEFREFCRPYISPIEELRLLLDELWPNGASIATIGDVKPFVGIARIVSAPNPCNDDPHVDCIPGYLLQLEEQFSAIAYLQMPPEGGGLQIWDIASDSVAKLTREDGTLDRTLLPAPATVVPGVGDLVILNTRYPHTVAGFKNGVRIVQSSFFGYRPSHPLVFWS